MNLTFHSHPNWLVNVWKVLIASKKHIFSQKMTSLIDLFIIGFQILVKQAEKVRMSVVNCQTHIITNTEKLK
jgi:hypothetical protein